MLRCSNYTVEIVYLIFLDLLQFLPKLCCSTKLISANTSKFLSSPRLHYLMHIWLGSKITICN